MKIIHLNGGNLYPLFLGKMKNLISKFSKDFPIVCHCLYVEYGEHKILIDSGFSLQDMDPENDIVPGYFKYLIGGLEFDTTQTITEQLKNHNIKPEKITDIMVTHFDLDHVSGIKDFPNAKVHLSKDEWDEVKKAVKSKVPGRYLPEHFEMIKNFRLCEYDLEWNGFKAMRDPNFEGLIFVSLPGHTKGHQGIYLEARKAFFVGDAFFHRSELMETEKPVHVNLYNRVAHHNLEEFNLTLSKLIKLHKEKPEIKIYNTHDQDIYKKALLQGSTFL